jgi:diacylglycerol kinase (ATP)
VRIKIIVNPKAGRGKAERAIPVIHRLFASSETEFDMYITQAQGDAMNEAKRAVQQGYDAVISAGGDGTANEVVNGIAGHDVILGIIPCGSGNDLAISMEIPRNTGKACEIILRGNTRRRDLGRVIDRYFANSVGIGFDAAVAKTASQSLRSFPVRGIPLYILALFKTLRQYKGCQAYVTIDDEEVIELHPLLIAVGIGKTYGGGIPIVPCAIPDDGLYDVCTVEAVGSLEILSKLPKALRGTHVNDPKARLMRGRSVRIQLSAEMPLHMDGEVFEADSMEFSIIPGGLQVFHP